MALKPLCRFGFGGIVMAAKEEEGGLSDLIT